jgi:hypothetical protein
MGWTCRTHGRYEKCVENIGRKPEENESLGVSTRRCEDIIKVCKNVKLSLYLTKHHTMKTYIFFN